MRTERCGAAPRLKPPAADEETGAAGIAPNDRVPPALANVGVPPPPKVGIPLPPKVGVPPKVSASLPNPADPN